MLSEEPGLTCYEDQICMMLRGYTNPNAHSQLEWVSGPRVATLLAPAVRIGCWVWLLAVG